MGASEMVDMDVAQFAGKTIAVLAGGTSGEREVSLRTGQGIAAALESEGLTSVLVDPTPELPRQLAEVGADVCFNGLHGGAGEDGTVQAILDWIGMPYTGCGVLSSALTLNKVQSKRVLGALGVANAPYVHFRGRFNASWVQETLEKVGLPAVTKPNSEGSSLGVTICRDEDTLARELESLGETCGDFMVDRLIEGTELTVGVLGCGEGAYALPVLELRPHNEFYDYAAKYTKGLTDMVCPAEIADEHTAAAQALAVLAHRELGCHGISRCDMHLDAQGKLWFHEVNSCPGMTETSDVPCEATAAGLSYTDLVLQILASAFTPRC